MDSAFLILRIAAGLFGGLLIFWTVNSAIQAFITPRGVITPLIRALFRMLYALFHLRVRNADYMKRDRIMAQFSPIFLFLIPFILLLLISLGYMAIYWALDPSSLYRAFRLSGSSLLTLGYASQDSAVFKLLEFSEATLGLVLIALLIAYLPTMYAAFSRRESNVALLEARAGSPPTPVEFIARTYRNDQIEMLRDVWLSWQTWFAEVEESHISLAPLSFFRSPKPDQSWVTAAGVVLDSAALLLSAVETPFESTAAFSIRTGYIALNHIAEFLGVDYITEPPIGKPISISREEFDRVCDQLARAGVPLKADRDQAWKDFYGWRINYDVALLSLAALTMAPYAEWVSDRSSIAGRPRR